MKQKSSRRQFLQSAALTGIGLGLGGKIQSATTYDTPAKSSTKHFNMCGYAAPPLDRVRIGFIGTGNRGIGAVVRMSKIEGVEIKAICDVRAEKAEAAKKKLEGTGHNPSLYTSDKEAWKTMCERPDLDLIYIATPWSLHTPMAVYAMNHGKHACVEVPAATTMDQCWELVETSEKTKKHCMMLENCCYDFFEMLTLNMARQGFFGEIVHCEGAYLHYLLESNFSTNYYEYWRLKENATRKGNLYPTHGLGPICQIMDINRGDKMDYLVSVSTNDFMMAAKEKEMAAKDDAYKQFLNKSFNGNINTSTIRTHKGKTIMLQHDVTSPRPYSRIHLVSGTKATAQKYPLPARIAVNHEGWVSDDEFKILESKFQPPLIKKIGELAKQVGGHGGMDFLMDWRTIDCLRNGLPLDQDVYDAALWSAIFPLSEKSVTNKSAPVNVPDFTFGDWQTNQPVDISMTRGGNTGIKI